MYLFALIIRGLSLNEL